MTTAFRATPLILTPDSDAVSAPKSITFFLDDLDRAIMTKTLHIFSKVPDIYTKVFLPANVVQQQAGRDAKGAQ